MKLTVKQSKENFFDRKAVQDAIGKAKVKVMSRQGGYVRKTARNGMKKKKGPSPAGTYPNEHVGKIDNLLFYAFDKATNTMVVGPVKLGKSKTLPNLHDGGYTKVWGIRQKNGTFVPMHVMRAKAKVKKQMSEKQKAAFRARITSVIVPLDPRPFMDLALAASKEKLAEMWKDQVKR